MKLNKKEKNYLLSTLFKGYVIQCAICSVLIFGGTFHHFENYFIDKVKIQEWPPVYQSQDKLLIDTHHPNRSGMTQQQYCDHIIDAVIQWMEKR